MVVEVRNLRFAYPSSHADTLKGIDFDLGKGEIFGFLGPNGAGKSTTQKILIGLIKNYRGQVRVFGQERSGWGSAVYERIGVCFEMPGLYHKLTARENLNLIRSFYSGKTEDPLRLLQMVGLAEQADVPVRKYSKGMKVRLNFIRSLLHNPELLFLDEPTAGLDPVNTREVMEIILQQKAAGKAIFLTTHNMAVADQLCDQVAFIVDGTIQLTDSPQNLRLQSGHQSVRVTYQQDDRLVEAEYSLGDLGANARFLQILQRYPIRAIHSQEASLEDIFIRTTGRSLT